MSRYVIDPLKNAWELPYHTDAAGTISEEITVSIPIQNPATKFDVYFLADNTSSMGPIIDAIKTSSHMIVTMLSVTELDIAFGVGNYLDFFPNQNPFTHQLNPTTNIADVQQAIAVWHANPPNHTIPEAQLYALNQIAEKGDAFGWRDDAQRIIVWIGDAPGHEPICRALSGLSRDITVSSLSIALRNERITVIAISSTIGGADAGSANLDSDPNDDIDDNNLGPYAPCGAPDRSIDVSHQATKLTTATGGIYLHDIRVYTDLWYTAA